MQTEMSRTPLGLRMKCNHPHVLLGGKHRFLNRFFRYKIVKHRPFPGPKINFFYKIGSRNEYRSIEHKNISVLTTSELPNPSGRPKKAPNTFAISVDLGRLQSTSAGPLHKQFKIKYLGLLTYVSAKSLSRRFSLCNSQRPTPSGRRAMKETVFVPYLATPR